MFRATRTRPLRCQALESRRLLAGDVDVFLRRGDLLVRGDNADNSIELRVDTAGNLVAEGLNDTTVNGETGVVQISESGNIPDDLRVRLGGGDDTILIEGVSIGDDLIVNGGRGDDAIGLLRVNVGDDAAIYGLQGSLDFSMDLSTVEDDLRVVGGREADLIVFDTSRVGDDTVVLTSSGDDQVIVLNSQHQDDVYVSTGRGDDFVAVIDTQIGDDTTVLLGSGDDSLVVRDSALADRVIGFAGPGRDALALEGENSLNERRRPILFSFEDDEVNGTDQIVEDAIAALVDSGARRPTLVDIATGNESFSILVSLLVQAGLVDAVSTTAPLTVFAPTNLAFADFIEEFELGFNDDGSLAVPLPLLQSVLMFHVAAGTVDSGAVLTGEPIETLQGESITVDLSEGVQLDGRAGLVLTDVRARNGIIHVIDTVLTPAVLDVVPE